MRLLKNTPFCPIFRRRHFDGLRAMAGQAASDSNYNPRNTISGYQVQRSPFRVFIVFQPLNPEPLNREPEWLLFRLEFSPSLTLSKIKHFSKVSPYVSSSRYASPPLLNPDFQTSPNGCFCSPLTFFGGQTVLGRRRTNRPVSFSGLLQS